MADSTPYSTVIPFVGANLPSWINSFDAERLGSYKVYDDLYHVNPDSFSVMLRGVEEPILVPTAKGIINTLARFVGKGFNIVVDPTVGDANQQKEAQIFIDDLVRREALKTKFKTAVRESLKFGDAFWYLQADSNKPEGSRISITTLDPGLVQMLEHPTDPDRIVGAQIVEQITVNDKVVIQRQRWLKGTSPAHPDYNEDTPNYDALVFYDKVQLETEDWETDKAKIVSTVVTDVYLPVSTLPIYHWKNNSDSNQPYGSSELRSLERLFAGINQAASDEDTALAMAGLGMYRSNSGGPVDENGDETDWLIGPGRVIEDESFERVSGVSSVDPSLEHIRYLEQAADGVVGITDVTRGSITAQIAESGIALSIKMSPTIDAAEEKDLHLKDVFDQLLHDLTFWIKAVEGIDMTELVLNTTFSDKLPRNRDAEIKEMMELLAAGVLSVEFVVGELKNRFGYNLPDDILAQIANEKAAATAAVDPYADRMADPEADA